MVATAVLQYPVLAFGAWSMFDPVEDADYSVTSDIQGSGVGDMNVTYTIEIRSGSTILGSKADSVGPDENWSTLMEPHPTQGWHQDCGSKDCEYLLKRYYGSEWHTMTSADITITKTCGV